MYAESDPRHARRYEKRRRMRQKKNGAGRRHFRVACLAALSCQLAQLLTRNPVAVPPLGAGVSTTVPTRFAPIVPMVKSARGVPVFVPTLKSRARVFATG